MEKLRKPKFRIHFRFNKSFYKIFNWYFVKYVDWKDKFGSVRVCGCPQLLICFLWFQLDIIRGSDEEWEFYLWCEKYQDGDIDKAIETWPWQTMNQETMKWEKKNPYLTYNK